MKFHLFVSLFLAIVLMSCSSSVPAPIVPTVQPGMALIRGRLLDPSGSPLSNRSVRLAPVYDADGKQAYVVDDAGGIGGVTDAEGGFALGSIPPGRYVLVVVVSEGMYAALLDRDGNEQVFDLRADKLTDIGAVRISL
jgi:hypothetical protein